MVASCESFITQLTAHRLGIITDDIATPRAALVAPAQGCTAEEMNRLLELTGGLPFVAVTPARSHALLLQPMPPFTESSSPTTPTHPLIPSVNPPPLADRLRTEKPLLEQLCSVEAREGISTGISAHDRAATVRVLGDPQPQPRALVRPGHIFPVLTREGGVLVRAAIPEGAVDAVHLAGFTDAAVVFDLLNREGAPLNPTDAEELATRAGIPTISLTDLIKYRLAKEPLIERLSEATIPSTYAGDVRAIVYRSKIHDAEHVALVKGEVRSDVPTLVRVQTEHSIADVFGGGPLFSRMHLHGSMAAIAERGTGILLYLRRSPVEQALQPWAAPKMMREYGMGAQILRDLGVGKIELLTSASRSLVGLDTFGIEIVAQQPIPEDTTL